MQHHARSGHRRVPSALRFASLAVIACLAVLHAGEEGFVVRKGEQPWMMGWDPAERGEGDLMVREVWRPAATGLDTVTYLQLPPDYSREGERRYPVLYYLHGSFGSPVTSVALAKIYAAAMADGRCPHMIVAHCVTPLVSGSRMWADNPDWPIRQVLTDDLPRNQLARRAPGRRALARRR
jgi:hypothetical protein